MGPLQQCEFGSSSSSNSFQVQVHQVQGFKTRPDFESNPRNPTSTIDFNNRSSTVQLPALAKCKLHFSVLLPDESPLNIRSFHRRLQGFLVVLCTTSPSSKGRVEPYLCAVASSFRVDGTVLGNIGLGMKIRDAFQRDLKSGR